MAVVLSTLYSRPPALARIWRARHTRARGHRGRCVVSVLHGSGQLHCAPETGTLRLIIDCSRKRAFRPHKTYMFLEMGVSPKRKNRCSNTGGPKMHSGNPRLSRFWFCQKQVALCSVMPVYLLPRSSSAQFFVVLCAVHARTRPEHACCDGGVAENGRETRVARKLPRHTFPKMILIVACAVSGVPRPASRAVRGPTLAKVEPNWPIMASFWPKVVEIGKHLVEPGPSRREFAECG